jgi:hypothetical protein
LYSVLGQIPATLPPESRFLTKACSQAKFNIGDKSFSWWPVDRFGDNHYLWCISSMRWWSLYICEYCIKVHLFVPPWRSFMPPWPFKRHAFMLFILSNPAMPNSILVGSPLLIGGLEHFSTWQKPLQPYKASAWPSSPLQLMSSCGVGKSSVGSFLTGWWAT